MLRINQLAKELGVANQEVIEACEKRLGLQGKSHSSNLTDDQADQLRRGFQGKTKGEHEAPPLALPQPSADVAPSEEAATPASTLLDELQVEGLDATLVGHLVNAGYPSAKSLYNVTAEQLMQVAGMEQDLAFRLIDAVQAHFGE